MTANVRSYPMSCLPGYYNARPGIQIGTGLKPDASEEEIAFAKQLGADWR